MKILFLPEALPSPLKLVGPEIVRFKVMEYLAKKYGYKIMILPQQPCDFRSTDCNLNIISSPRYPKSLPEKIFNLTKSVPLKQPNTYYSLTVHSLVKKLAGKSDLIYSFYGMALYAKDINMPKVLHAFDCISDWFRQSYLSFKNPLWKAFWWFQYQLNSRFEEEITKKFQACIYATPQEMEKIQRLFPWTNGVVIPNPVDCEFFCPVDKEEWPLLVFVGNFGNRPNVDAVIYFLSSIYGTIRRTIPQVKLYIVGEAPPPEILKLASSDESVIVTGSVKDVRPYLARACIAVAPFISGTGIKQKVLEAMAMGKPVVSTSIGVRGINAVHKKSIIIANKPEEFAEWIIKLLLDKQLRKKIGLNARKFIEKNHNPKRIAKMLDNIFRKYA